MSDVKRRLVPSRSGTVDNPISRCDWIEFLDAEEQRLWQTYEADGKRLVSDANVERESRSDYIGREILELLQNADDAATEAHIPGRVLFEHTEHGLLICNTGSPFSFDGFESILLANLSPKRKSGGILIGAKGLGFRSLLNWTDAPILLSGQLEVGFSRAHSEQQVNRLYEKIPELRERMDKSKARPPILRFPYRANLKASEDPLLARARKRTGEFDTIVGIPFRNDKVNKHVESQLQDLNPRLLLFLQSIKEIEIAGIDARDRVLRREEEGDFVRIASTGMEEEAEEWLLKTATEPLPAV